MDRSSFRSNDRSHDTSSDDRFDNLDIGNPSVAGTDGTHHAEDKKLLSAATVDLLSPMSSASELTNLQPGTQAHEELIDTDRSPMPALASSHQFSEIPEAFITVFDKLVDVDANASSNHRRVRHEKRENAEIADAIKFLKRQSGTGKSQENTDQYKLLRRTRKENSSMEMRLPESSAFRALLYPPTGGVRDTRTGLYAELRQVTIDKKTVFLLCFPGTGAARNRDTQWNANLKQALGVGGLPRVYPQALALATELKDALARQGLVLAIAGHSMGGGIANFIGLALDIDSYCFNAAALGGACLNKLEIEGCLTADRIARQNHLTLKGDYASNASMSKAIGLLSPTGKTPQQVGRVFRATADDEDFPEAINPLARHPLDAMQDMMYAQKMALWRNTRQAAAATSSSTSSTSAHAKPTVSPSPDPHDPSSSDEIIGDSESG